MKNNLVSIWQAKRDIIFDIILNFTSVMSMSYCTGLSKFFNALFIRVGSIQIQSLCEGWERIILVRKTIKIKLKQEVIYLNIYITFIHCENICRSIYEFSHYTDLDYQSKYTFISFINCVHINVFSFLSHPFRAFPLYSRFLFCQFILPIFLRSRSSCCTGL